MTDDTTKQLLELRDHHARELQRIDDALALLKQVGKLARKASSAVGKARAKARRRPDQPKPIDVVREVFRGAGKSTLTRDEIVKLGDFAAMQFDGRGTPEGRARRVVGLTLAFLTRHREIKSTRDGFVARAIAAPPAGSNGHAAP